jgi:uncharacterized protein YbaR (Trm112 family)
MKIWLQEILACPIDKHYPLELLILEWETIIEEIEYFWKTYQDKNIKEIEKEDILKISEEKNDIKVRDNIVLKSTSLVEYLKLMLDSILELRNVKDLTDAKLIEDILSLVQNIVKEKIETTLNAIPNEKKVEKLKKNFSDILPELYLINKIKVDAEIKEGLLYCSKCNRWYPIIDTIPQMLPDKYRNKKEELPFLEKWKMTLQSMDFFKNTLLPFSL